MNEIYSAQIQTAVAAISRYLDPQPEIGLVLGSGLSALADSLTEAVVVPYHDIPHWPTSTVHGHAGRLIIGNLAGKQVLVQQGRAHYYEGYSQAEITFPVRVMHALGVRTLIVTNAAGGINADFTPGDLMLITDHINFVGLAGLNPLRGPNDDAIGPRFPDMTFPYDPALQRLAEATAVAHGFTVQKGVYAYVAGPSFETPAELRYLQAIGVDAVGMSTVPEVIVARHAGIRVLGISSITNKANLHPQPDATVTHDEVLETGKRIVPNLMALLRGVIQQI